jgi:uncharacterized Zn finger protein
MTKFRQEHANDDGWSDWIHPLPGYKMACCDCGLVHNFEVKIADDGNIIFRVSRNERSTAAMRREKRKKASD